MKHPALIIIPVLIALISINSVHTYQRVQLIHELSKKQKELDKNLAVLEFNFRLVKLKSELRNGILAKRYSTYQSGTNAMQTNWYDYVYHFGDSAEVVFPSGKFKNPPDCEVVVSRDGLWDVRDNKTGILIGSFDSRELAMEVAWRFYGTK